MPPYAGAMKRDVVRGPGESVNLSGWSTTASALVYRRDSVGKLTICTTVRMDNRAAREQEYSSQSWTLLTPEGALLRTRFASDGDELSSQALPSGSTLTMNVCFGDKGKEAGKGQYVLSWQPGLFSSPDRGVWLNTLYDER